MGFPNRLASFLQDPPPEYAFELSPAGIAFARRGSPVQIGFHQLPPDVIAVSPVRDNVLQPDELTAQILNAAPTKDPKKRRRAAVILPDYCARVAVLDFDTFPADPKEQLALVRFRMKKSVPFDVESAAVSYIQQPPAPGEKGAHVVVAVISMEIVSRYEQVFRKAGFHPGLVTTSALTSVDLMHTPEAVILAKLSGATMTVTVLQGGQLRLVRCVELPEVTPEEAMNVLFPTVAFCEDELGTHPRQLLLCGFHELGQQYGPQWAHELGITIEPLRSRLGTPGEYNAGLLGYLESVQ